MKPREINRPARAFTNDLSRLSRIQRGRRKRSLDLDTVAFAPRRNDLLPPLKLEHRAVSLLRAPARAIRAVNDDHVADIARSMLAFGVVDPPLITSDGEIVDGVSVLEAARAVGIESIPCLIVDHLKSAEIRVLRIALNRLAEKGSWNLDELRIEFRDLAEIDAPIELTNFTPPEIDALIMVGEPDLDAAANYVPTIREAAPAVCRLHDRWKLGPHTFFVGDATKAESYTRLFEGAPPVRCVFADPPYNIRVNGFAVGAGSIQHREFVAASGEMTDDEFVEFLFAFLNQASAQLMDGGIMFVCMDWRHAEFLQRAARQSQLSHINTVVWSKPNGGLGGLYRSAHEFVLVFKKGGATPLNNVGLGKHGRDRTNNWHYPGANQRGSSAHAEMANHPTPKPVELVADALLDVTNRGEIALDPFAGSGTTIIAAHKVGRIAHAMELDPIYADLIIQRFERFTGIEAIHSDTGQTFKVVAAARRAQMVEDGAATAEVGVSSAGGSTAPPGADPDESAIAPDLLVTDNGAEVTVTTAGESSALPGTDPGEPATALGMLATSTDTEPTI